MDDPFPSVLDNLRTPEHRYLIYEEVTKCMLKGGSSLELAQSVQLLLYNYYKDDYTIEYISNQVLAAHEELLLENGYAKSKRNVQQELDDLIDFRGKGDFNLADVYNDLKLNSPEEKHAVRMALNRFVARGKIEKLDSGKTGSYRKPDSNVTEMKFVKGKRDHFPITLPFGLSKLCYIHPKSIIVIAGSKSSGKTAALLSTALENQDKVPVVYLNSDMGEEEYTDRMTRLGCTCEEDIRFKVYSRSSNFHDLITPEKKIFMIDFLEIHENFYEIGKPIKQIWDKLKDGIAIIAIQMKAGGTIARGGEFTKEKARLYLAMDFLSAESCTKVTIVDAKAPTTLYADGVKDWTRKVKIIGGSKFEYIDNWNNYGIEENTKKKAPFYR